MASSDEQSWRLYLTAQQVVGAALCLLLSNVRRWRSYGVAGATWFVTQAMDEWTNGNLWKEHQWEYPLAALLIVVAWLARNAKQ